MLMQMARFAEETNEHQLGCRVRVQGARNQEIGDGDAVGGFRPFGWQRGERGRSHVRAEVDISDGGEDAIEGGGEDLERVGCLHGVVGSSHL